MSASNSAMRPLLRNESTKRPSPSRGRIFGAMPPATKTPPTARPLSARFPASAPYADTKISRARMAFTSSLPRPAAAIAALGSPVAMRSVSHAGSVRPLVARTNR